MADHKIARYLDLSTEEIRAQINDIMTRDFAAEGQRQVSFNAVETLLCYGLFNIVDPHHYGGRNMDSVPSVINKLADFFKRTPGSILSKMLNLDGSRSHTARAEPLLFATLSDVPDRYYSLYQDILQTAREL